MALLITDEAVEEMAKAAFATLIQVEEGDPDDYETFEELDDEDREKVLAVFRAGLEAAAPLMGCLDCSPA